jgi:D-arginine dehydrogenase
MSECDYIVIGGGMAGCSVAYFLSETATVVVLERESQPGYHTTGRSAASYTTVYGNAVIRGLTLAGRAFYESPPSGFTEVPLLTPLGALFFSNDAHLPMLEKLLEEVDDPARLVRLTRDDVRARVPVLGPQVVAGAYEKTARGIDVHALHQGFIRGLKANGGTLHTDTEVHGIEHKADRWHIEADQGTFRAPVVINAAGAWGDVIAERAGVPKLDLRPLRRTALTFRPNAEVDFARWPITVEVAEDFYLKPESGLLMLSPADEIPSDPCDAQPEEIDVAGAIDLVEKATTLRVKRIEHKWAGLRTFTSDRTPAAGFEPTAPGFFWLVGQGGYGIQTAPGLGQVAAALAQNKPLPAVFAETGLTGQELSPARFRQVSGAT